MRCPYCGNNLKLKLEKASATKKRIKKNPNEPEPTNGRLKKFSDFDWSKDVLEIIGKYPTLKLVISGDIKNIEFWDGHVDIMSEYFPTDSEMKRWFNKAMFEINRWQTDNPHRASKSAKGLRQRISTWLSKEYQKLEVTKR